MPTSRHAPTFAAALLSLAVMPACASMEPAQVSRAAAPNAHPGLAFAMPACDAISLVNGDAAASVKANERCDQGDAVACFDASLRYACGVGVAPDERKAAVRAEQACRRGHAPSCASAGALYLRSPDSAEVAGGVRALRLGCAAANDGDACNNLAIAMTQGLGVPQDEHGALFMFDRLCKRGNRGSCRNAATVRENLRREAMLVAPPCEGDHPCMSVVVAREEGR
jgi:TPR repeat protein